MNYTFTIYGNNIPFLQAQFYQYFQTGYTGSTGANSHDFYVFNLFIDYTQCVYDRCANYNCRTVLIVMKDRNIHAITQFAFYLETLRRFDIFQIDAAEGRFQTGNDLNQFVRISLIDFEIEYVNNGKLFTQNPFAFHHRFGCQWTDITQTQYRRTIGNNRHQMGT